MLDTIANVKTFMGISGTTYDTVLTQIMGYVDNMIKQYVGYEIEQATITGETHSTDAQTKTFTVDYPPIISSFVVKYDSDVISSDSYSYDSDTGIIEMTYSPSRAVNKLTFDYVGGYASVPDELKFVFNSMVKDVYSARTRASDVKSERLGDYSVTYRGDGAVVQDVIENYTYVLDNYRIRDF